MFDKLLLYYSAYPTVRYATVSVLLIALCTALLGVLLVLKRYSMIGDGLSHVTFGATAIATVLGLSTPIYVALPLTVIAAVCILKIRSSSKVQGDAAIAMISTAALAFGYLILNLFADEHGASSDACATLFGSGILSIKLSDVIICLVLSLAILFVFIFFHNRLFAVTFDEDFARSTGIRAEAYNTMIAVVTGITVVVAMNMLGALLVSALVIFPALSSMRLFKTFRKVTICAAVISVACALVGVVISLLMATPIGPTIVVADLSVFIVCFAIGFIKAKI
ncbi:MAG: metal ABC transporter permease [Clostridia bacterium]|nr:metal ABC transporter permease [Clostridia bacterium]